MLIVVFAYAGIGVFATAASQVREPGTVARAAWITVVVLAGLYIASIGLILLVLPWRQVGLSGSPFVTALGRAGVPVLGDFLNAVVLVASFGVMAGSVFSAGRILDGLAEAGQAPRLVADAARGGDPRGAITVTTAGVSITIAVAYALPHNVYGFLISAAGFLTFLNWSLIIAAFLAWRRRRPERRRSISSLAFGQPVSSFLTLAAIVVLAGFALRQPDQRMGFYAFALLAVGVSAAYAVLPGGRRRRPG